MSTAPSHTFEPRFPEQAATARTLRRASGMQEPERAARMRALRAEVRRHDIFWWADSFLHAALDEHPGIQPVREPGHP